MSGCSDGSVKSVVGDMYVKTFVDRTSGRMRRENLTDQQAGILSGPGEPFVRALIDDHCSRIRCNHCRTWDRFTDVVAHYDKT